MHATIAMPIRLALYGAGRVRKTEMLSEMLAKPKESLKDWLVRRGAERLAEMSTDERAAHERNCAALDAAVAMPPGTARERAITAAVNTINESHGSSQMEGFDGEADY